MLIAAERSQYEPRALPRAPMQPLQQEPQVARQEEWPQATELELPADSPLPLSVTTNTENDWEIIEDSFNEKVAPARPPSSPFSIHPPTSFQEGAV